jgi:hypothetical protein
MPRNPDIDRALKATERTLKPWISHPPKLKGNEFCREHLRLSVLSPLSEVSGWWKDERRAVFGGGGLFGTGYFRNTPLIVYDDEKAPPLIADAVSGDMNADAVLSAIAAHHIRNACTLPPRLRDYIARKLDASMATGKPWPKPSTRGRKRNGNAYRDYAIMWAVEMLVRDGFQIDNSRAQHSASSIVADALTNLGITLDDRSVARIYRANRKFSCLDGWAEERAGTAPRKKRAVAGGST